MDPLLKKLFSLVLVFTLLIAAFWVLETPLAPAYARYFRAFGNLAFFQYLTWADGSVRFLDLNQSPVDLRNEVDLNTYGTLPINKAILKPKAEAYDTLMVLTNRAKMTHFGMKRTSARLVGYSPTALIIAIFLATPTTWRRRLLGLGFGLVFVHGYIFVRLAIDLAKGAWGFGSSQPYALFHLSASWDKVLDSVSYVIAEQVFTYYPIMIFFWIAYTLLSGNLAAILRDVERATYPDTHEQTD